MRMTRSMATVPLYGVMAGSILESGGRASSTEKEYSLSQTENKRRESG